MEKEQKKLILVAVSVGVFLLVTITVALIIITPKTQEPAYYSSMSVQPAGNVQPAESTNHSSQPIINNTQETNINFDFDNAETIATVDSNDGSRLTIQIPRPSAAAVPDNFENAASANSVVSVIQKAAATESASSVPNTPAAQPAAPARSAAARTPAASTRTTSSSKSINDYWIQTGAFTAKIRADDARDLLESKGLISIIENREIDGRTWYRVRLGPYTSENEANYWLALVKSIDGFNESQVRQTVRQQ